MGGTEQKYVNEAFATNWIAPLGPNVDGFEKELASYLNVPSSAALSSGTAAIHLALVLAGVEKGDTVLCQSFTFSATANPVMYQGATPIFIDSELDTWNMDPELLKQAIQSGIKMGKRPKACIVVHLYGMPAKICEISAICKKYNVLLIEDAAEALGSMLNGKKMGTFGDFGIYSFNGNKIITTSGGGALIAKEPKHVQEARFLATQAKDAAPHYEHSKIGYNYRMSNVSAGIGRGQLEVLDQWIDKRRANFAFYKSVFNEHSAIETIEEKDGRFSNRWLSCFLFATYQHREKVREELALLEIESRPLWKPMHLQPIFKKYPSFLNGNSERLFERGLCLPSGSNLTSDDLQKVGENIAKIMLTI